MSEQLNDCFTKMASVVWLAEIADKIAENNKSIGQLDFRLGWDANLESNSIEVAPALLEYHETEGGDVEIIYAAQFNFDLLEIQKIFTEVAYCKVANDQESHIQININGKVEDIDLAITFFTVPFEDAEVFVHEDAGCEGEQG